VALQADGKIVIAGSTNRIGQDELALVRFNADGSLDTTFGGGGFVAPGLNFGEKPAMDLAIQPDGRIVVAGSSNDVVNGRTFTLARFNANGSLDTTFGSAGFVFTDVGGDGQAHGLALATGGGIVVAGSVEFPGGAAIAVARYVSSGALDPAFGGTGVVSTAVGANSLAYAVAIQSDGKVVAAGQGNSFIDVDPGELLADFAVVRYQGPVPPSPTSKDQCKNGGWQTSPIPASRVRETASST
jgi:uncharacterized delta-60 repeat protein